MPLCPCVMSPPATAPTAAEAITGLAPYMASLHTSPHGSKKRRVASDGTTTRSAAA